MELVRGAKTLRQSNGIDKVDEIGSNKNIQANKNVDGKYDLSFISWPFQSIGVHFVQNHEC